MNPYEVLLLLDPDVPDDRHAEIVARTREVVERGGGTWEGEDIWGRRRLAYELGGKTDGVYRLATFSAEPETLDEVSRVLRITDGVMRHMATRRAGTRPAKTVAAVGPGRQDEGEPEAPSEEGE